MKCMKCGAENQDTAKFCRKCGISMEAETPEDNFEQPEGASTPPPVRQSVNIDFKAVLGKAKRIFNRVKNNFEKLDRRAQIAVCAGGIVVLLLLSYFIKPHPLEINLEDYVSIEFDGYNNMGTMIVDFDEKAFETAYLKKNKSDGRGILERYIGNESQDVSFANAYIRRMPPYVKVRVTPDKPLSNGDKVEVCFEYDNRSVSALGLKYKGDKIKKKVKNLEEIKFVDLSEFCSVNFSGIDTRGVAEVKLDMAGLNTQMYGLTNYFTCQVIPQENLSNGDKVTVSFNIDEENVVDDLKMGLKAENFEVEVEGLKEIEMIDPFEGVEILFEGAAPFAKVASVSGREGFDYVLNKRENLDIGDQVIISVSEETKNRLYEEGYELTVTEKAFPVENIAKRICNPNEVSEEALEYLKTCADDIIKLPYRYDLERYDFKSEFCGMAATRSKSQEYRNYNDLILLYRVERYDKEAETTYIYYTPIVYMDIAQNPDGTVYNLNHELLDEFKTIEKVKMLFFAPYQNGNTIVFSKELEELLN